MTDTNLMVQTKTTPAEPLAMHASPELSVKRLVILLLTALAGTVGLSLVLFQFSAMPMTWDELLYMGIAWEPRPEAFMLNRYGHIYSITAFMRLFQDPFVASRAWWSVVLAGTVVAAFASLRMFDWPARLFSGLLLALLLLTQVTFAWVPGMTYPDYSAMLAVTLSFAVVFGPVMRRQAISLPSAFLLGLLLAIGLKFKETSMVALWLTPLLLLDVESRFRLGRKQLAMIVLYVLGIALGLASIIVADHILLRDALFSLRPESWRELWAYNEGKPRPDAWTWLTWLLRPDSLPSFLLYAGATLALISRDRSFRIAIVCSMPVVLPALLVLGGFFAVAPISGRYISPILPALCVVASAACTMIFEQFYDSPSARQALLLGGSVICGALLLSLMMFRRIARAVAENPELVNRSIIPLAVFCGLICLILVFGAPRLLRAPAALIIIIAVGALSLPTASQVIRSCVDRDIQRAAAKRFLGLREVVQAGNLNDGSHVLVDSQIYDGIFFGRGKWSIETLIELNSQRRLESSSIAFSQELPGKIPEDFTDYGVILARPEVIEAIQQPTSGPAPSLGYTWERHDGSDGKVSILIRKSTGTN